MVSVDINLMLGEGLKTNGTEHPGLYSGLLITEKSEWRKRRSPSGKCHQVTNHFIYIFKTVALLLLDGLAFANRVGSVAITLPK